VKTRVLAGLAALLLALLLWLPFGHSQLQSSMEVQGELTRLEVAQIRQAVWRKLHPPILPTVSLQSLREAPGRLAARFRPTHVSIYSIEARTANFVAVFGRPSAKDSGTVYFFWGVFRETNGWKVYNEYHLDK